MSIRSDWDNEVRAYLTEDMARDIRRLRVDEGCTWRRVSELFEQLYPGLQPGFAGHQLSGCALCSVAAELLGEDGAEEPWN